MLAFKKNYSSVHRGIASPDSTHADAFEDSCMGSIRKPFFVQCTGMPFDYCLVERHYL